MESAAKRCHYEVLGLSRDCAADEIRSAYKKLALQRHPDKLVQSGLSHAEATAQFQELAQAYEVLSDPKERAWYDSHRSQILFSDLNSNSVNSAIPNLFSFFSNTVFSGYSDSGRGFYKVYSDLFDKIYANEINFARKLGLALNKEAPLMGNLESPYVQVTAFYNYWLGFCTVMDFCWADQYDAMAGVNRKSRRVMEEENKKVRKKARREYNETVRGLAEFVKKRDKRVIDMAVKRNLEMERKKEEERERKKRLEKERIEKARAYVEPEWTRVDEEELEGDGKEVEEEEEEEEEERKRKEFYCVVCGKKFKSDKQWKNHEQSKKHKEKVAEFRDSLGDEEDVAQDIGEEERVVDEVGERIREELEIGDKDEEDEENVGGFHDVEDKNEVGGGEESDGDGVDDDDDDDDEMGVLEAMVAGRKSRKNVGSRSEEKAAVWSEVRVEDESDGVELPKSRNNVGSRREEKAAAWSEVRVEDESDGVDFMEYNNTKSKRKNRRSKKNGGEATRDLTDEINRQSEEGESNGHDHSNLEEEESSSHSVVENESNGNGNVKGGDQLARDKKSSNQHVDKKGAGKKDTNAKSKNSSKGKKAKATSKNSSNTCDTCGEEFESRTKLHKHLGESGHATLKHR
ncbi:DNAJ protein JJJ1 homolog [Quercus robur]|uniref:DNAJ protein JJJ1 homolog n=1 Tax=Quercus robur TaxID=38942 RepID=UPI0021622775|nr:DNAJ protein JJJ1 homolog [Quercus robur]